MNRPLALISILLGFFACKTPQDSSPLNILILHTDQWRAQAFGYAGDPNVMTPNLDAWAKTCANFTHAVSGMPVCTPHRASLLTGQRPLTHGLFMNDVQLDTNALTMAEVLVAAGYETGYIGKWHLDGSGRSVFTPPGPRRQGFSYWKALECSHNYNQSAYYFGASRMKRFWKGYDSFDQARDAEAFLHEQSKGDSPFFLMLAWGTPHAPYHTAPESYRNLYDSANIALRPNVPEALAGKVKKDLAGYYAHCTALDDRVEAILTTLRETGLDKNTIVLFTSDHGDLLGSQGFYKKQQPYEESIRVPMLFQGPGIHSGKYTDLIQTEDLMPTLLGLAGIPIPERVEGRDYSARLLGKRILEDTVALLSCVQPFGQWNAINRGGKEFRGIRTLRYTYAKDLQGPWLLFDNVLDPYQQHNLVDQPQAEGLQKQLDQVLALELKETEDEFLPGLTYVERYGYPPLNETLTVPYTR